MVDVLASVDIVQGVDHNVELLHELEPKPFFLNLAQECLNLDRWVLLLDLLLESRGLRHVDVLSSEQKLAIQVADVDGVQVDDLDVSEPSETEGLDQFAADAACSDNEDLGGNNFLCGLLSVNGFELVELEIVLVSLKHLLINLN